MVKTLGVVFIAILIALPIMFIDERYSGGFLYNFFHTQALGIIATVLALNVATVTFLVGHLISIENKANKSLFSKTKDEIKQNVYFMTAMLLTSIILTSASNKHQAIIIDKAKYNPVIFFDLIAFILVFIALMEIVKAIFKASSFVSTVQQKNN
jgi:hypothetical protein